VAGAIRRAIPRRQARGVRNSLATAAPARPHMRKAWAQGIAAVATRRICAHGVGFIAGILLARLLRPADFGIYFIANSYITMLGTLQTTNMSGALIQSREPPT